MFSPFRASALNERGSAQNKASAANTAYHCRLVRTVDLPPEPSHMDIDEIRARNKLVVPNISQERFARQDPVAPFHHVSQQPKFARPEIDRSPASFSRLIEQINLERSNAHHRQGAPSGILLFRPLVLGNR